MADIYYAEHAQSIRLTLTPNAGYALCLIRTSNSALAYAFASFTVSLFSIPPNAALETFRGCLHRGRGVGPQVGEVTCGWSPHLSCKGDQIKMRDYMDRRVTPPKRVTSTT